MVQLSILAPVLMPDEAADILSELEEKSISTAQDLLFTSSVLSVRAQQFKNQVQAYLAAEGRSGDKAYEEAATASDRQQIVTGIPDLDTKLLEGGFDGGDVVEILGDAAAGTTYLCMRTVLKHLLEHKASYALWLDTSGSFSAEKASYILETLSASSADDLQNVSQSKGYSALDRLIVARTLDLSTAAQSIQSIRRSGFPGFAESSDPAIKADDESHEFEERIQEGSSDADAVYQAGSGVPAAQTSAMTAFIPASQVAAVQSGQSEAPLTDHRGQIAVGDDLPATREPASIVTAEKTKQKLDHGAAAETEGIGKETRHLSLVVIDGITPLIKGILSGVTAEGHARMTAFMRLLRSTANEGCVVLLTNTLTTAYSDINAANRPIPINPYTPFSAYNPALATRKASLGPSFTFLTDITLCLTPVEAYFDKAHMRTGRVQRGEREIVVEVWRSRRTPAAKWTTLKALEQHM